MKKIYVIGWVAAEYAATLIKENKDEIKNRFTNEWIGFAYEDLQKKSEYKINEDFLISNFDNYSDELRNKENHSELTEVAPKNDGSSYNPVFGNNKKDLYEKYIADLSECTLNEALWRISLVYNTGFDVNVKNIPIPQTAIEIYNFLQLNPYDIPSKGGYIAVSDDDDFLFGDEFKNTRISCIGFLTNENAKRLLYGDEVRYLDKPDAYRVYGDLS